MFTSENSDRTATRRSEREAFGLGERVVASNREGVVVGMIDTGEYVMPLKSHTWSALATGVLVRLDDGTVIHYREPGISLRRPG